MSLQFFIDNTGKVVYAQAKANFETDALEQLVFSFASSGVYTLNAQFGAFVLTGKTATLAISHLITAAFTSYTLTPKTAGLVVAHKITTANASFTLTRETATLQVARLITASYGAFAISPQTATLKTARLVAALYGAFAVTAETANLAVAHLIMASSASFALTAEDAGMVWTSGGGPTFYTLDANFGAFAFTAQSATLTYVAAPVPVATPQPALVGPFGPWYTMLQLEDEERRRIEEEAKRQAQERSPVLNTRYEPQKEIEAARSMLQVFSRNEARPRKLITPMDLRPVKRVMTNQVRKTRERREREVVEIG